MLVAIVRPKPKEKWNSLMSILARMTWLFSMVVKKICWVTMIDMGIKTGLTIIETTTGKQELCLVGKSLNPIGVSKPRGRCQK